ncbi:MAG: hypothetical protein UW98_C0015G0018, partial [Parcubacteria group bacterium GW2011_GWC2_45_15]
MSEVKVAETRQEERHQGSLLRRFESRAAILAPIHRLYIDCRTVRAQILN